LFLIFVVCYSTSSHDHVWISADTQRSRLTGSWTSRNNHQARQEICPAAPSHAKTNHRRRSLPCSMCHFLSWVSSVRTLYIPQRHASKSNSQHTASTQSLLAHPLQPQFTHCTPPPPPPPSPSVSPAFNPALGTRQIHVLEKLVSFVCTHLKQHNFSYPCFFHLAINIASA